MTEGALLRLAVTQGTWHSLSSSSLTIGFLFALLNVLNKIFKGEYININFKGYLKHAAYYNPPSLSNLSSSKRTGWAT